LTTSELSTPKESSPEKIVSSKHPDKNATEQQGGRDQMGEVRTEAAEESETLKNEIAGRQKFNLHYLKPRLII